MAPSSRRRATFSSEVIVVVVQSLMVYAIVCIAVGRSDNDAIGDVVQTSARVSAKSVHIL